jgi:hypothetical protein
MWPLLDIGDGLGTKAVVEGVKEPWSPHSGHGSGGGHTSGTTGEGGSTKVGH